jgi:putative intracellular protease/amidase
LNIAALYVHEGFADWEASFILPELVRASFNIRTVAQARQPLKTMGSVTVLPDMTIDEADLSSLSILILPGGESWLDPSCHQDILKVLPELKKRKIPIAAICGATVALARAGLLDDVRHTSNYLPFLKKAAPQYRGEKLYSNDLAVCDGGIITASGIGALEFTYEIMKELKVYDAQKSKEWYEFFKNAVVPSWLAAP